MSDAAQEPDVIDGSESPIHLWFGLSYSSYLVLPRSVLQSMPREWQERFVAALREADKSFGHLNEGNHYGIELHDPCCTAITDPLADYQRGRRRLEPKA